ncbi:hypothetical protein SVAN01_02630 [Stagonosporopsis vannaccii]|nr:hypothetical protein SVAN01_02630 [Stagonosporopsis vannaccii]
MHADTCQLPDWPDQESLLRVARAIGLSYSVLACILLAFSSERALTHTTRPTLTRSCRLEADAGHHRRHQPDSPSQNDVGVFSTLCLSVCNLTRCSSCMLTPEGWVRI